MTSELADGVVPTFTAEEKAYFDNRGNVPETAKEEVAKSAPPPAEDPDEPLDLVDEVDEDLDEPDTEDEKPRKQVVPIKALHKEREERKALTEKLRTIEIERARMEERMNMMLQQMQGPDKKAEVQQQDEEPGDDDPIGQIQWLKAQVAKQRQQEQETFKARREQEQIERHVVEVDHVLTQAMTDDPTVKEAFDFGVQALRDHYQKQGVPPSDVDQYIRRDMQSYALRAPKTKAEIAEYAKANARYFGWAEKPAQADPGTARLDAKPSTKSLSQASGSATGATITAQDLIRMPADEFQRFIEKNPKKYRQMMGG